MAQQEINYWLMKSEPDVYSLDQLCKDKKTLWDGIRNYQARNFMRQMRLGDKAFFYHSNCNPPSIVGLMEVINTNLIDPTQFDPKSNYYDPKSFKDKPRWDCAELKYIGKFSNSISLEKLKERYKEEDLQVVKKGNRLSIIPVPNKTAKDLFSILGELI